MDSNGETTTTATETEAPAAPVSYDISLMSPDGLIYGTITGTETENNDILQCLTELQEIESSQLELAEQSVQIQYNTYTMTAYIFAVVLAFSLINFFKSVINSVLGG